MMTFSIKSITITHKDREIGTLSPQGYCRQNPLSLFCSFLGKSHCHKRTSTRSITRPVYFYVQCKKNVAVVLLCNIFFILVRLAVTAHFQNLLPNSSISAPNPKEHAFLCFH
jgi:hypothetical protein